MLLFSVMLLLLLFVRCVIVPSSLSIALARIFQFFVSDDDDDDVDSSVRDGVDGNGDRDRDWHRDPSSLDDWMVGLSSISLSLSLSLLLVLLIIDSFRTVAVERLVADIGMDDDEQKSVSFDNDTGTTTGTTTDVNENDVFVVVVSSSLPYSDSEHVVYSSSSSSSPPSSSPSSSSSPIRTFGFMACRVSVL